MQQHSFSIPQTAHYYALGVPGPHIRQFWIVCHGYAQLADDFLKDFTALDDGSAFIIAPEGSNYFYRKGFSGPVGANWMTRHHREAAIAYNNAYLQGLYELYRPQLPADVRIVVLGFSQGAATVCRWIFAHQPHFHELLLWAGLPPNDLDFSQRREYLADKNLHLLYGSSDPFLTPDRIEEARQIETTHGIDFSEYTFDGGHEIPENILRSFLKGPQN